MAFSRRPSHSLLALSLAFSLLTSVHAYFVITQPSGSQPWANGSPFPLLWTKGLDDGIGSFDLEITRMSEDGLYYVALNIPATSNSLNIYLEDVPTNDDYFIVMLNSTSSTIYCVSDRFSVTNSTATQNPSANPSVPTVTISGAPNAIQTFLATLGPPISGARSSIFGRSPNLGALGFGGVLVLCTVFLGGAMAVW